MSCAAGRPTFRLLDRRVGWTDIGPEPVPCHLTEWYDPEGIQLLLASGTPAQGVIDVPTLLASLPPPRLARLRARLMAVAHSLRDGPPPRPVHRPLASGLARRTPAGGARRGPRLASSRDRFAIAADGGVQVWTIAGETQVAVIAVKDAECLAFVPGGDLLVATTAPGGLIVLQRFGPVGDPSSRPLALTIPGPICALAVTADKTVWLATGADPDPRVLWSGPLAGPFQKATAAELAAAFPPTGLIGESAAGFCLQETGAERRRF